MIQRTIQPQFCQPSTPAGVQPSKPLRSPVVPFVHRTIHTLWTLRRGNRPDPTSANATIETIHPDASAQPPCLHGNERRR
jgi:hypothetical protein